MPQDPGGFAERNAWGLRIVLRHLLLTTFEKNGIDSCVAVSYGKTLCDYTKA